MKLGILTFVNTTNYGASLQAYALQQVIAREGHECEIIGYTCRKVNESHSPQNAARKKGIKRLFAPVLAIISQKSHNQFRRFENEYCVFSKPCDEFTIASVAEKYDRIIVGSDQVWNVDITGNDKSFFLDFIEDDKKKYSYAASVGTKYFKQNISEYESLIRKFQVISIREKGTAEQLRKSINREDIITDVDPTLLNYKRWSSFVTQNNKYGDYIFLYFIPEDPKLFYAIRKFAKEKGCKLIHLKKSIVRRKDIKTINIASPIDFINLIAHARYVISGSFHALCFSLIFHKEFYVTSSPQKDRNGRLTELLSLIGQTVRVIGKPDYQFTDENLDYSYIELKFEEAIEASMNTIRQICSGTGNQNK